MTDHRVRKCLNRGRAGACSRRYVRTMPIIPAGASPRPTVNSEFIVESWAFSTFYISRDLYPIRVDLNRIISELIDIDNANMIR